MSKRHDRSTTKTSRKATCVIKCNKHIGFMFHVFFFAVYFLIHAEESKRENYAENCSLLRLTPTPCHHSCYFHSCCCSLWRCKSECGDQNTRRKNFSSLFVCTRSLLWCVGKAENHFISFHVQHRIGKERLSFQCRIEFRLFS